VLRHFRSALHKDAQSPDSNGSAPSNGSAAPVDATAAERARFIVEQGCDAVLIVDVAAVIRYVNPAAAALLGHEDARLRGMRLTDLLHPDDVAGALALVTDSYSDSAIRPRSEWRLASADGTKRTVDALLRGLEHAPAIGGVLVHLRDITDRAVERRRHAFEALHDSQTRLPNRVLFRDRVSHALAIAHRKSEPITIVLLDIDGFRGINDIFGREAGDALLSSIATRLGVQLRGTDTAARLGADEFAIMLEQMSDESDFVQISERLLNGLSQPFSIGGREIGITVSIGIANATPDDDADTLLRNAEVALSLAKRRGRGACEIYEPRMHAAIIERLELESELRRAIEARDFSLRYQPIVILQNRRVAAVEAFLHWEHPERGTIPSSKFLPVAEDTGLIIPLGRWGLIEACRQGTAWQRALDQERPLTVTWNTTSTQLLHPGFVNDVSDALRLSGIDARRLVLEISDETVTRHAPQLNARLHALKALGVRIAIDEFGTRHSSLRHLPGIPVDILKIDPAFVGRVTEYGGEATLAQVIVALGKSMHLRTVADGIEQEEQLAQLIRWRCEFGQGHLFGGPQGADEISALLAREATNRGPREE
jgi:diguanylate cyclase (GGDEF)-like protein/PAS domain S-box-containing protein